MYGALLSYGSDGRHNPRIAYVTTCQGSVTGWQTISALKYHVMNCSKSLIIYLRISYRHMWSGVHIYDISKNFRQSDRWLEAVWYENINEIFKYPISRLRKYARLCETFRRKLGQDGRALVIPPWWRHQMDRFSALLAICAGNSLVTGEFPEQKPVTWSFDIFFDLRLNKQLSKQSWGWWFETPSRSL